MLQKKYEAMKKKFERERAKNSGRQVEGVDDSNLGDKSDNEFESEEDTAPAYKSPVRVSKSHLYLRSS